MDNKEFEEWLDSGAEYWADQAASLGIDSELVKLAGMSSEERHVLEWYLVVSSKLTPEESSQLRGAVRRTLAATVQLRRGRSELERSVLTLQRSHQQTRKQYQWAAVFCALILAIATFSSAGTEVHPDDGQVHFVKKKWWGLSKVEREIRWMQSDEFGYPAWMAKDASGKWYPFLVAAF